MTQRRFCILAVASLMLAASVGTASAQYNRFYEEEGFFIFLDSVFTTPRNTDQVVATTLDVVSSPQVEQRILTDWGSELAGRINLGYQWPGGTKVSISYWKFDNDERTVGDGPPGGFTNFAIGPAILVSFSYYGAAGYPGHFDISSEIEAESLDVSWGRSNEMTDGFSLEWSLGLRYAKFEETMSGFYGSTSFGFYSYAAAKVNEGEMTGLEAAVRGTYHFSDLFSLNAGLGLSMMDGDVSTRSSLTPVGPCNTGPLPSCPFIPGSLLPTATAVIEDKDRSGTITDFDLAAVFHLADDRLRLTAGYEHSTWHGLPADLARNNAGNFIPLSARETVVFSGFKIGVGFLF